MPNEPQPCWICRFTVLTDQVSICTNCGAFPEECAEGECGCYGRIYDA